jgi:hypothetical protein
MAALILLAAAHSKYHGKTQQLPQMSRFAVRVIYETLDGQKELCQVCTHTGQEARHSLPLLPSDTTMVLKEASLVQDSVLHQHTTPHHTTTLASLSTAVREHLSEVGDSVCLLVAVVK